MQSRQFIRLHIKKEERREKMYAFVQNSMHAMDAFAYQFNRFTRNDRNKLNLYDGKYSK